MLTPLDIENKRFSKKINGYNVEEVDDFLDQVTLEYGKLYKENNEFKEELATLRKDVEHYKGFEQTLQNTLVMAQSTADDMKNNAQKQAEQIIREAQTSARQAVDDLNKQECDLTKKMEEMEKKYSDVKAKLEKFLLDELRLLQNDEGNPEEF